MTELPGSGEPADVLLVEDNMGDVRLTQEAFEDSRIHNALHVATDGVEALDFLYQRNGYEDAPAPDVVLLDLYLPRMDGTDVLVEIRDDDRFGTLPVIVLTSSEAIEDVARSYTNQANAYLTKPVDPDEFVDVVRTFQQFWLSIVRLPSSDTDYSSDSS